MQVTDIFKLQENHTVFVGFIQGTKSFITKGKVEVLLDGKLYKVIAIEGEWITECLPPQTQRAVSTTEFIDIDRELITQQECQLRTIS